MNSSPDYLELINGLPYPYFEATEQGSLLLTNAFFLKLGDSSEANAWWSLFETDHVSSLQRAAHQAVKDGTEVRVVAELKGEFGGSVEVVIQPLNKETKNKGGFIRGHIYLDGKFFEGEGRENLDRQREELEILNHLAEAISSSLDLDEILQSICHEMVRVFQARNTGIALLDDQRTTMQVVAFHSTDPNETDATGLQIDLEGNDASLFVIKTKEPIVVPDAQFNPISSSLHDVMVRRGTSCLLVVPLLARGEVIGTIGIPSDSLAIFSREEVRLAQTIAGQIASVIDNARLHRRVKRARDVAERELEIGSQIQTSFFPTNIPQLDGYDLFFHFRSARQVSGDFYDAFSLGRNNLVALVIADVCDKGVGAALFMVLFRSLLRANLLQSFSPEIHDQSMDQRLLKALAATNNYVAMAHSQANMFATVFVLIVDGSQNQLWYINCGHDAPMLCRKKQDMTRLAPTSPAIGVFPDLDMRVESLSLDEGDSLIAFTDGVTDALSVKGELFGEKRVAAIIGQPGELQPRLEMLLQSVEEHTKQAEQFDDITCFGISKKGHDEFAKI
jgi:sigma-B regulation protein RsbU (phosphoserine phosphatase)